MAQRTQSPPASQWQPPQRFPTGATPPTNAPSGMAFPRSGSFTSSANNNNGSNANASMNDSSKWRQSQPFPTQPPQQHQQQHTDDSNYSSSSNNRFRPESSSGSTGAASNAGQGAGIAANGVAQPQQQSQQQQQQVHRRTQSLRPMSAFQPLENPEGPYLPSSPSLGGGAGGSIAGSGRPSSPTGSTSRSIRTAAAPLTFKSPELRSALSLQDAQSRKIYMEGYLSRRDHLTPEGKPLHVGDPKKRWHLCFVQLSGTVLSVWSVQQMEEAARAGKEVPPSYINVTDCFVDYVGTITESPQDVPGTRGRYENVFAINTAGQNRILFGVEGSVGRRLVQAWVNGIRLASWEKVRLEEIYTGALIRARLGAVGNAQQVNAAATSGPGGSPGNMEMSVKSPLLKGKMEGWVKARFMGTTEWRKCWLVLTDTGAAAAPSSNGATSEDGTANDAASTKSPSQQGAKKESFWSKLKAGDRSSIILGSPSTPSTADTGVKDLEVPQGSNGAPGLACFYESKKAKKPFATLAYAAHAFAVYPSRPELVEGSSLFKVEGAFPLSQTISATNRIRQSGWVMIMPELESQSNKGANAEMMKWTVAFMDAFKLYGRPGSFDWDARSPASPFFAYPIGPYKDRLFLDRELSEFLDTREERHLANRSNLHGIMAARMRGERTPVLPPLPQPNAESTKGLNGPRSGSAQGPDGGEEQQQQQDQSQQQPSTQNENAAGPQRSQLSSLPPLNFGSENGDAARGSSDNRNGVAGHGPLDAIGERSREGSAVTSMTSPGAALSSNNAAAAAGAGAAAAGAGAGAAAMAAEREKEKERDVPPYSNGTNNNNGYDYGRSHVDESAPAPAPAPALAPASSLARTSSSRVEAQEPKPSRTASPLEITRQQQQQQQQPFVPNSSSSSFTAAPSQQHYNNNYNYSQQQQQPSLQAQTAQDYNQGASRVPQQAPVYAQSAEPAVQSLPPPIQSSQYTSPPTSQQQHLQQQQQGQELPQQQQQPPPQPKVLEASGRGAEAAQNGSTATGDRGVNANLARRDSDPYNNSYDEGALFFINSMSDQLPAIPSSSVVSNQQQRPQQSSQTQALSGDGTDAGLTSPRSATREASNVSHQGPSAASYDEQQQGPASIRQQEPSSGSVKANSSQNQNHLGEDAMAAYSFLDKPPSPAVKTRSLSEQQQQQPQSQPYAAATPANASRGTDAGIATGSAAGVGAAAAAAAYPSTFGGNKKAQERKLAAQAQQQAHQEALAKPGRAGSKKPKGMRLAGAGGRQTYASSDEDEDEEEDDEDQEEEEEESKENNGAAAAARGREPSQASIAGDRAPSFSPRASVAGMPSSASTYGMPPQQQQMQYPQQYQQQLQQQPPYYRASSGSSPSGSQIAATTQQQQQQQQMQLPRGAPHPSQRQTVFNAHLGAGHENSRGSSPRPLNEGYSNSDSPNSNQGQGLMGRSTFVQLGEDEQPGAMTAVFQPHGLLQAGAQDKAERSAKQQESEARAMGAHMVSVDRKPGPPQAGLLGAITAHERDRKKEGGLGATLTERERERVLAERRQREEDAAMRQQMQQMQQMQQQHGGAGMMPFNPMMWQQMQMMGMMNPAAMYGGGGSQIGHGGGSPSGGASGGMDPAAMQQQAMQQAMQAQMMAAQAAQQAYMQAMSHHGGGGGGSMLGGEGGGGGNRAMSPSSSMGMPGMGMMAAPSFNPYMSMYGAPPMGFPGWMSQAPGSDLGFAGGYPQQQQQSPFQGAAASPRARGREGSSSDRPPVSR